MTAVKDAKTTRKREKKKRPHIRRQKKKKCEPTNMNPYIDFNELSTALRERSTFTFSTANKNDDAIQTVDFSDRFANAFNMKQNRQQHKSIDKMNMNETSCKVRFAFNFCLNGCDN